MFIEWYWLFCVCCLCGLYNTCVVCAYVCVWCVCVVYMCVHVCMYACACVYVAITM